MIDVSLVRLPGDNGKFPRKGFYRLPEIHRSPGRASEFVHYRQADFKNHFKSHGEGALSLKVLEKPVPRSSRRTLPLLIEIIIVRGNNIARTIRQQCRKNVTSRMECENGAISPNRTAKRD